MNHRSELQQKKSAVILLSEYYLSTVFRCQLKEGLGKLIDKRRKEVGENERRSKTARSVTIVFRSKSLLMNEACAHLYF